MPVSRGYPSRMTDRISRCKSMRTVSLSALALLGFALSGCAQMSDGMSTAFADPAKYELYECPQLEAERKALATRSADLQGLMAKAETGFAGPVVAEMAYRNDYVAVRGQARFAEEAWQRNKCRETPPAPRQDGRARCAGQDGCTSWPRQEGRETAFGRRRLLTHQHRVKGHGARDVTPANRRSSPAAPASAQRPRP